MVKALEFEKPLVELTSKIEELKRLSTQGNVDLSGEITKIEARASKMKKDIYANLTPFQIVQIARHPQRPNTLGLARLLFDPFMELHGDRAFRDDPSIVGGIAKLDNHRVMLIGHQKGHDTKENIYRNFGMPHPEGYRKALRLMMMANKFKMPIITFIDTPGAYPGLESEERGQAEAIARNLREMAKLDVPVLSFVLGEGGSGGALGIGVANRLFMLEYSVYSVISPEGCASILFHDAKKADFAAKNLRITAKDITELGISDGIIKEPIGGAHHNWDTVAAHLKKVIKQELDELTQKSPEELKEERYQKFRAFGRFELIKQKAK